MKEQEALQTTSDMLDAGKDPLKILESCRSAMELVGYDMTAAAAKEVYETAGLGPDDLALQHNIGIGGSAVVTLYRNNYPLVSQKSRD